MTLDSFKQSVATDPAPPEGATDLLRALWHARRGQWHEAHELVQDLPSSMASWIHAHLHLVEGDLANAAYWYRRAGRPASDPSAIDAEWELIAAEAVALA
jgi:hypothetical protein